MTTPDAGPGRGPTLADLPLGRRVDVGLPLLDPDRVRRLAELGLRAGAEVVVLHRTAGRGRVVAVGDTRIALDLATLRRLPVAQSSPAAMAGADALDRSEEAS